MSESVPLKMIKNTKSYFMKNWVFNSSFAENCHALEAKLGKLTITFHRV